jgi:hypothetical protein
MAAFQLYLQAGKQKSKVVVDYDSHVVFGGEFPGGKGSMRRCIVLMQQPVLLSPMFGATSSHIFTHLL